MGEHVFQIAPVIFSMNRILIITFEVIDFETDISLNHDDVFGKIGSSFITRFIRLIVMMLVLTKLDSK